MGSASILKLNKGVCKRCRYCAYHIIPGQDFNYCFERGGVYCEKQGLLLSIKRVDSIPTGCPYRLEHMLLCDENET